MDKKGSGGTVQAHVTERDCRDGCDADGTCVGFNFDTSGNECTFYFNAAPAVANLATNTNSRHYRRCDAPISKSNSILRVFV